jgi:hypothetical protein
MRKPMSEKTAEMKRAIEDLFPGTMRRIEEKKCPICAQPIKGFKSELSRREYEISGMCQACQDEVFE